MLVSIDPYARIIHLLSVPRDLWVNIPGFGEWADGHILLQEHGSVVSFRNLKIRELPAN